MNWNEAALHRLLGWGLQLTGQLWYIAKREEWTLPPENKKNPVFWIRYDDDGCFGQMTMQKDTRDAWVEEDGSKVKEYWSATRVRDMLRDILECLQGATIGYPFVFGAGVLLGWFLFA